MPIHDVICIRCERVERDALIPTGDLDHLPDCSCGGARRIFWNPSYNRAFGGSWNGLSTDKITVFEGPQGQVEFPGRADTPMPARYAAQGFVRRSLAPFEVAGFEKRHGVVCESLHWNRNGIADRDDPIPTPPKQPEFFDLLA